MTLETEKVIDMFAAYHAAKRNDRVMAHLKKKYNIYKRLNMMRGRFFYPAAIHRRTLPSDVQLVRNTALNTLNNEYTDTVLLNMMGDVKNRMIMQKANALLKKIMSQYAADSFQRALEQNGIDENYNEEDDPDYEEDDDDEDDDDMEEYDDEDDE
ncbi:hypothetical protein PPL_06213 [Heterostelium album PN500]|uniref:Uncharacterized protein n=1 Tax=Heterostelium pallidum (strain ATCC 26659 / Pp 5 / PN500) TaxID=670386 RepID=D3BCI8_HETP5|nr:hypothetical protein PPL_06213 [Heterostelium album PN500]EFA80630.1 hypothetical protein PPL_06213 [Heterostelium album PN500]|eukprot:XP_020432750.1 hypothetical protein PPL_06213 [Heterostelium album PN500]